MDENSDDFFPVLFFFRLIIRFFLKIATNLRISSQSRMNTGGSPMGADTSTIFPKLCGPDISSPLCGRREKAKRICRKEGEQERDGVEKIF